MNSTDFGIFQVFGGLNLVFNFYHGKTGQMQMFQAQEVDKKIRKSIKREKKEQLFARLETSWQHHEIGPFVVKRKETFFKILHLTKHSYYTTLKDIVCIQSCAYQFGQPLFQDSEETIHSAEKMIHHIKANVFFLLEKNKTKSFSVYFLLFPYPKNFSQFFSSHWKKQEQTKK